MSDEMVQEKTETVAPRSPENGHMEGVSGEAAAAPDSSPVAAAPATMDEPAPAQPVASVKEGNEANSFNNFNEMTNTPAPPPAAPAPETPSEPAPGDDVDFEQAMRNLDMSSLDKTRAMQEGDVITGTVMRVDKEGVLVDVGAKSEGIIRLNELSRDPNLLPEDVVKVGERIRVFVMEPENRDGNPILSKKRADFEQAWEKVQQAKESGETLTAMVSERVKGGLVVDLGIRGFVPASHVGNGSLKNNLDRYVGQSISLKVIEVDKERRKVVLSNKMAMQEERDAKSQETKLSLAPGQIRHGMVRRLTAYGAFIDLGGIDGLLHISEMSWTRINDPKEVLREGQELDVLVLKMDLENNRVSLGLRQILPDPWAEVAGRYKDGDVITGTVTRIVPFGAFVQVEGGVEGIIPNAELPRNRGGKTGAGVNSGDEVQVKVIGLRPEERKLTLSMRALLPPEEREPAPAREPAEAGAAPREGGGSAAPRESGGAKRGRGGREREEAEDYSRYAPREAEPRSSLGEAFAAAKRNKRDRRATTEEDDDDLTDIDVDDEPTPGPGIEVIAEADLEDEKA